MSDAEQALRLLRELERQPTDPGRQSAESAIAASAVLAALLKYDFDLEATIVDLADGA